MQMKADQRLTEMAERVGLSPGPLCLVLHFQPDARKGASIKAIPRFHYFQLSLLVQPFRTIFRPKQTPKTPRSKDENSRIDVLPPTVESRSDRGAPAGQAYHETFRFQQPVFSRDYFDERFYDSHRLGHRSNVVQ